ncbi:MAG: hypothetical protein WBG50_07495 [Desulfomonilaceae bacterium]
MNSVHSRSRWVLRVTILTLMIIMAAGIMPAQEKPIKAKESGWIGQSQLGLYCRKLKDSRFMPYRIVGKKDDNDFIFYKGYFMPFPPDLDHYYAYWGMTDKTYRARKTKLANLGFREIWHQSFYDALHAEIHQAVWLRLYKPKDSNKQLRKSEYGTET